MMSLTHSIQWDDPNHLFIKNVLILLEMGENPKPEFLNRPGVSLSLLNLPFGNTFVVWGWDAKMRSATVHDTRALRCRFPAWLGRARGPPFKGKLWIYQLINGF